MAGGGSKPGERRGGRKPGSVNKTTAEVKAALVRAFADIGGHKAFAEWGAANPTEFYKLWCKLLPTEIANADGGAFKVQNVTEVVVTSREQADAVLALNKPGG